MAKKQVKTPQVECWGNPKMALDTLNQFCEVNDQYSIRNNLSKLCCLLTPLGFNCSMSFFHSQTHFCITTHCFITIADEQFTYIGNEFVGDDVVAYSRRIADFISKHTAADGLFHYTYERRADA